MRKAVYFIPAVVFLVFYGLVAVLLGLAPGSIAYIWIALFVLGGFLLAKGKFWGGFIGLLPGIHLMYMSTRDTGQIMEIEFPVGFVITVFYLSCCLFVLLQNKKIAKAE